MKKHSVCFIWSLICLSFLLSSCSSKKLLNTTDKNTISKVGFIIKHTNASVNINDKFVNPHDGSLSGSMVNGKYTLNYSDAVKYANELQKKLIDNPGILMRVNKKLSESLLEQTNEYGFNLKYISNPDVRGDHISNVIVSGDIRIDDLVHNLTDQNYPLVYDAILVIFVNHNVNYTRLSLGATFQKNPISPHFISKTGLRIFLYRLADMTVIYHNAFYSAEFADFNEYLGSLEFGDFFNNSLNIIKANLQGREN